jgi:hypothetical protein
MAVTKDQIADAARAAEAQRLLVLQLRKVEHTGKRGDPREEEAAQLVLEAATRTLIATYEIENA